MPPNVLDAIERRECSLFKHKLVGDSIPVIGRQRKLDESELRQSTISEYVSAGSLGAIKCLRPVDDSTAELDGGGGIPTVSRSLGEGTRLAADPAAPSTNSVGIASPPEVTALGSEPDLSVSCRYGGPDLPRI